MQAHGGAALDARAGARLPRHVSVRPHRDQAAVGGPEHDEAVGVDHRRGPDAARGRDVEAEVALEVVGVEPGRGDVDVALVRDHRAGVDRRAHVDAPADLARAGQSHEAAVVVADHDRAVGGDGGGGIELVGAGVAPAELARGGDGVEGAVERADVDRSVFPHHGGGEDAGAGPVGPRHLGGRGRAALRAAPGVEGPAHEHGALGGHGRRVRLVGRSRHGLLPSRGDRRVRALELSDEVRARLLLEHAAALMADPLAAALPVGHAGARGDGLRAARRDQTEDQSRRDAAHRSRDSSRRGRHQ